MTPGPVVVDIMAPQVEPVWDLFPVKYLRKVARCVRRFVCALPCCNDDAAVMSQRVERSTGQPGQIPRRIVEETVLVRVALEV